MENKNEKNMQKEILLMEESQNKLRNCNLVIKSIMKEEIFEYIENNSLFPVANKGDSREYELVMMLELSGIICKGVLRVFGETIYLYDYGQKENIKKINEKICDMYDVLNEIEDNNQEIDCYEYRASIVFDSKEESIFKSKIRDVTELFTVSFLPEIAEVLVRCKNGHMESIAKSKELIDKMKQPKELYKFVPSVENYSNNSYVYVLECRGRDGELFYKIGKTNNKNIKKRYVGKNAMPYEYDVLYMIKVPKEKVFKLEEELHKKHASFSYVPNINFDGYTECFSHIDKFIIEDILK